MSSESLLLMVVLLPLITRGLVGFVHRSRLRQRLPRSREAHHAAIKNAIKMYGCSYLAFMAFMTIDRNATGAVGVTTIALVIMGSYSFLFAGGVQALNKWVVTDLLAETLMDYGWLGLLGGLGAIIVEGNPDNATRKGTAILMIVGLWGSRHLLRILASTARYGDAAREHPGSGHGKTGLQPG